MRTRLRLFKSYLMLGYSYAAAWAEADRQLAFRRRHRRANG
jgi:hypothetical protein